jgi:CheY-like chemotaxis protein
LDRDFTKELTLLYIEDDEQSRKELSSEFEKRFKELFVVTNEIEALEKFRNNEIDFIICDINLPRKNTIEFLSEVKIKDSKIPILIVTTSTNQEYVFSCLKIGVTDYFVKPFEPIEFVEKIEKILDNLEKERELDFYNETIKDYMDTIGKVAVVSIFDLEYKLVYFNDFLIEVSKYDFEELVSFDFFSLLHPDLSKEFIKKITDDLENGQSYKGNLKYISKDKDTFYANTTIVPIKDNSKKIEKYICVKFITTKEENERREFKKRILYDFQETKRVYKVSQDKINELTLQISKFENYEKKMYVLDKIQENNQRFAKEISLLESIIKELDEKQTVFTKEVNAKIKVISESALNLKKYEIKSEQKIVEIKKDIKVREQIIEKIEKELDEKSTKIEDLQDVLKHRKEQLQEIKI